MCTRCPSGRNTFLYNQSHDEYILLKDVCEYLQSEGMIAVYDATNTTLERRNLVHHIIVDRMGYKLFFIESICDDKNMIETNIMVKNTKG